MSYYDLVDSGLARWNGDGNNNATPDTLDATGNGRDGTWNGTPGYGTGLWGGNSFLFNGSNEIAASLGSSGFTNKCMAAWVKAPDVTSNDRNIIGFGQNTNLKLQIRFQASGAIKFSTNTNANDYGSGFDDDTWRHFAVVDNGIDSLLYVNGSLIGTRGSVGTYSSLEINLGSNNFFGTFAFPGTEIFDAIWYTDYAWTEDDIAELIAGPEPYNTVAPQISGTPQKSSILSVSTGTWGLRDFPGSNGTILYSYQWTRSNDSSGTGEVNISGATSSTYTPVEADIGKYLRCKVRAENNGGYDPNLDTFSNMTEIVANLAESFNQLFLEQDQLRGWYPCQDDAANTIVVDYSDNSSNGTVEGGENTNSLTIAGPTGYLSKAFSFDGNDRVNLGSIISAVSRGTLMAWARNPGSIGDRPIISTDGNDNTCFGIRFDNVGFYSGTNDCFKGSGSNQTQESSENSAVPDTWHFVSIVRDPSDVLIYVDGVSDNVWSNGSQNLTSQAANLYLGFGLTGGGTGYGQIDIAGAAAWSRKLASSEILEAKNGPEPINVSIPTLTIDNSGGWIGTVGTWDLIAPFTGQTNGDINYTWELRRNSDDEIISSGSGTSPSGSGLIIDTDYYLRVTASNNGGSYLPADSSIESYIISGSNYNIDNLDSKILNYSFGNSIIKNSIVNTLDSIINNFSQNNTIFKTGLINNIDSIIRNISLSEYIYKTTLLNNSDSIINNYSLSNSISKNLDINTFGSLIRMFSGINNIYKNSLIINIDSLILNKSSEETIYKISSITNRDNSIRSFSETNRVYKTSSLTSSGSLNNNYSEQNQLYLNIDLVSGIISINNSFSGNELLSITKTLLSHNSYNSIISDSRNISSNFSLSNIDNLIRVLSEASNLSFGFSIDIDNINSKILIFSTSNIISNNFNLNINNSKNNVISDQELITGNFNTVNVNNLIRSYSQTNSIKSNFSIINNDSVNILLSDTNRIERVIDLLQSKSKGVFISREDALLISYLLNNIDSKNQVLNGLEQISSSLSLDNTDSYILIVSPSSNITDSDVIQRIKHYYYYLLGV